MPNTARFASREELVDHVIDNAAFRKNIFRMVPQGTERILDFGCGTGGLLLRLMRDKNCRDLHGVELNQAESAHLKPLLDSLHHGNIEQDEDILGEKFHGYFNCILVHDVVEHLYDPWTGLNRLRKYLAPGGMLLVATPNLQYWDLLYRILTGTFQYGHGLRHAGHIRWFTFKSFIELMVIAGFEVQELFHEIPLGADLSRLKSGDPVTSIQLPPVEFQAQYPDHAPLTITYPYDISKSYPAILSHKLIARCVRGPEEYYLDPVGDNCDRITELTEALALNIDMSRYPRITELIGDWC